MDKLLVVGGGTAGHVNAGLAIIDYFKKQNPQSKILFVGTKRGIESKLVKDVPIKYINARGLKKESLLIFLYSILLIPISFIQSLIILLMFKPKNVIGVGGFASGPLVMVASFLKIKTYILEQNSVMGFTNKTLAKYVDKIFVSFPLVDYDNIDQNIKNKIIISGNPIRNIFSPSKNTNNIFNIFIFGGSQGARAINYSIVNILEELSKINNLKIYHQTGELDFEKIKSEYKKHKLNYELFPYIMDIDKVYEVSSLIISRSGASSISEIISCSVASILIPLPTAADNHQYYNAKYLEGRGASILIEQNNLNSDILINKIKSLVNNKDNLEEIKTNLAKVKKMEELRGYPQEIIYSTINGSN